MSDNSDRLIDEINRLLVQAAALPPKEPVRAGNNEFIALVDYWDRWYGKIMDPVERVATPPRDRYDFEEI